MRLYGRIIRRSQALFFLISIAMITCPAWVFAQLVAPYRKVPPDAAYLRNARPGILFVRSEYTKAGREINSLWIARRDGSDERFISYCSVGFALLPVALPAVSPDNRKVVFSWLGNVPREELELSPEKGLWLFDLETGSKERLYTEVVKKVLWSSDGRHLYFERGSGGLFRLDVQSKELTLVLPLGRMEKIVDAVGKTVMAGGAIFLEDLRGGSILYTRPGYDFTGEAVDKKIEKTGSWQKATPLRYVWLLNTRDNTMRVLSRGERAVFSPDGLKVAFTTENQTSEGKRVMEVRIIDADGAGEIVAGRGDHPSFSPDGKKLVFVDRGHYANPSGWLNLYVTDVSSGHTVPIQMVSGWQEIISHHLPSFPRIFGRYGYFQTPPQIRWHPSGEKLIYGIGYSFFFLADLKTNTSYPIFYFDIQVDPVLEGFDESGNKVLLTSPMIETLRRKKHPIKSAGWLNERDIWEVSLDGKKRKMLIENGFLPILIGP
ncbi:MAG TPA: hypothetical protein PLT64_06450 [Syntrophales bacterium]|nr:hypothetical protein [Syntrophales bacterium]HOL59496.1 hypothetical protein [Syntrophales bacterium]HPO34678.1 hypothetical protein [Syntrophales bacterium]